MNRFFISPEAVSGTSVTIPEEVSAQIRKVLRLKEGTVVQFLDNAGHLYESAIHYLDDKHLTAEVLEKRPAEGEPEARITLFIGLTQREKFEWILQKCTEAGAARFILWERLFCGTIPMTYCVVLRPFGGKRGTGNGK